MNKQVQHLLSILNPETDASEVESTCSKISTQEFLTFEQKCHSLFLVSHVYYKALNNTDQAEKLLQSLLLNESLNDKQQVQCLGRLAFICLFNNKLKAGKYYHQKAILLINGCLDNQKKSLVYVLFWVYSGMNNPNLNNSYSNFVLSYIEQAKNNYQQSVVLLKKVLKHESKIDSSFVKWKINYLSQPRHKVQAQQYEEDNEIFASIFQVFFNVIQQSQIKQVEAQKKKVLSHLRTVYNKYFNHEEYADLLDFLQQQITHLDTDEIPLSLIDSINLRQGIKPINQIKLIPTPLQTSQLKIPTTTSFLQSQTVIPKPQHNLMNSSTHIVIPKPTPLSYPTNNSNKTSNYTPPSHNFHSTNLSNLYAQPPVGWIGSQLIKLNFTTDGQKIKFFYIGDPSKKRLYYCERKDKPDTKFDSFYQLHNMTDVKQGKVTKALLRNSSARYDQELSFSIILTNKTRDFVALNLQDYSYWIYTLKRFLSSNFQNTSVSQSRNMSPTSFSQQKYGSLNMSRKL